MDFDDKPDPRFESFEEVFDSNGIAIGFTLPNNSFVFRYDKRGGWKDQKGNYYNSAGILLKPKEDLSEEEVQDEDDEILDEFQKILDEEEQGVVQKKKKEKKKVEEKNQSLNEQIQKLIQEFVEKKNVRESLSEQIPLYYTMKNKYLERIKPSVQNQQDVKQKNSKIQELKKQALQKTAKLKQNNKWLSQKGTFDYSGKSLDQNTYDRYWYGVVWVSGKNYLQVKKQIENSEEFTLLEEKSFYALKSKFYIKQKMRQTIEEQTKKIKQYVDEDLVEVSINNLPQNFPASYILELFEYSGTSIQEMKRIELINEEECRTVVTKKAALTLLNLQGYCHDEKCYVWLECSKVEDKKGNSKMIKIGTDSTYKTHIRQLNDTLTLEYSKEELCKLCTEEEEEKNNGYRFVVGINSLRRVLMFRGSSIDVIKIELFYK